MPRFQMRQIYSLPKWTLQFSVICSDIFDTPATPYPFESLGILENIHARPNAVGGDERGPTGGLRVEPLYS